MKLRFNRFLVSAVAAVAALSSSARAAQLFKDSTGLDINTLANWSTANGVATPDPTAFTTSDQLRFNENTIASGTLSLDLSANLSVGVLTLDSGTGNGGAATGNIVINSANDSVLTLNGGGHPNYSTSGIVLNSASGGTMTVNSDIALGASVLRFTTSRALTVNGDIALGANTLEFNTAGSTTTLSGAISGTGALNKAAGGQILALTNTANTFGGQVTLVAGTTQVTKLATIGNNSSLGTGSGASSIILNGATLTYTGAGGDTTDRAIDMRAAAAINNNSATGAISFTAANVTQGGTASARTFTLGGSNTGDNTFGSIVADSGTGANITSLAKNGAGTWVITGANTYTGSTTISAGGVLRVTGSGVLGGKTGSTADANNIFFTGTTANTALEYATASNLGAADQIRFRTTGGGPGILRYIGTTNQTVGKAIQCDTSFGLRLESNSVGGKVVYNGSFSSVSGNRPIQLGGTGTGDNEISSSIASNGSGTLTKSDAGKWILSGSNTFSGATTISGGTLQLGNGGTTGSLSASSAITNNANLTINRSNAVVQGTDFSAAAITGTGSFTAAGTGTVTLNAANSYSGGTTVNAGADLRVNGAQTGAGTVSVAATGKLGGSGSVIGGINVSGVLAPGNSIESLGGGALSFTTGSTYAYELQTDLYGGTPAVAGDLTYSSGTLSIASGTILTLTDLAASTALGNGSKLTLISYNVGGTAGLGWNGGLFTYLGSPLTDGATFTLGANLWEFNYNDLTGGPNYSGDQSGATSFVTITVVPEPRAALLGGIGLLLLIRRRR
jgi:fibronectin-binding autotransporter adhesin